LKEMADKIEQVKPAFLFWPSLGTFQYSLYVFHEHLPSNY
jgi:hypothetical protein